MLNLGPVGAIVLLHEEHYRFFSVSYAQIWICPSFGGFENLRGFTEKIFVDAYKICDSFLLCKILKTP